MSERISVSSNERILDRTTLPREDGESQADQAVCTKRHTSSPSHTARSHQDSEIWLVYRRFVIHFTFSVQRNATPQIRFLERCIECCAKAIECTNGSISALGQQAAEGTSHKETPAENHSERGSNSQSLMTAAANFSGKQLW